MRQIIPIVLLTFCSVCFLQAQTAHLTVEPNHSTVGFKIPIAGGITLVYGKFTSFGLELAYVDKDWTKSGVRFTIDAKSIDTGIEQRDEHLRSADFFDVEKYPHITFESQSITQKGKGQFVATGDFSMHGITKSMSIPFTLAGEDGNTLGVEIRMPLNRQDYGVGSGFKHTSMENFLADEIQVEINFWTKPDKRYAK